MTKLFKKISMIVAVLLVSVLALVACVSEIDPLTGGDPTATTQNNNSFVVMQGNYMYYTNGYLGYEAITEADHNKYGNVTKGAIYRANLDGTDSKVLVPQVAMDKNNKNSLNIFGGYLYFTSPSVSTSKAGTLQTNFTDFYRVKIDGSNLEKIVTVQSDAMEYKFTDKGLYYMEGTTVMFVSYDGKIGSAVSVEEKATVTKFSDCKSYTPGAVNSSMVSVFTKSPEDIEGDPYNTIFALNANGTTKEILNGSESKSTYDVKNVTTEGENLIVYYDKTVTKNTNKTTPGLFAAKFDKDLKFVSEKQMTTAIGLTVRYISYDAGVYVMTATEMYIPTISADGLTTASKISYTIDATITSTSINTIRAEGDKLYMYYSIDSSLSKLEMNKEGITATCKTGFIDNAEIVVKANIKFDGVAPVIIGNTLYYMNSAYYNYMYTFDMVTEGAKHKAIAVRTEDDVKAYKELVKAMDKDAREAHDSVIAEDIEGIDPYVEK